VSDTSTNGIRVQVKTQFLPDRSSPVDEQYVFAYHITISNLGVDVAQLISRHWVITTADGETEEVQGAGVVGEQPVLKPGQSFEYTSGVPLPTPSGFMVGSYGMVTEDGEDFSIDIPAFSLDSSTGARTLN
jgi:ApaG protein